MLAMWNSPKETYTKNLLTHKRASWKYLETGRNYQTMLVMWDSPWWLLKRKKKDQQTFLRESCFIRKGVLYRLLQHKVKHCKTLQDPARPCNTLQHCTTRCNTLQHTSSKIVVNRWSRLQRTATLQHIATHSATLCNTPQHTATHRNTLQHKCADFWQELPGACLGEAVEGLLLFYALQWEVICCSGLQCVAVSYSLWCNVIFSAWSRGWFCCMCCRELQYAAVCCGMLQCVAVRCSVIFSVCPRGYCCGGTTKLQCDPVRFSVLQCQMHLSYSVRCSSIFSVWRWANYVNRSDIDCNTLQHIAARCNTLQHTATLRNALRHSATHHKDGRCT